jgi:hyaluronan synthase
MNLSAIKIPPAKVPLEEIVRPIQAPNMNPQDLEADVDLPLRQVAERAESVSEDKDDLFKHSKQRISQGGRILVSKKAWVFRISSIIFMIAYMVFNIIIALPTGDPLIVYTTLMPVHAVMILVIGWIFYKNPAIGKVPRELVSVIIPIYNQEKLISGVIKAIFESTYPNMEIIAVNDGSKDRTGEVLNNLAKKSCRLKVVNKPNGGKRTAVAAGFSAARGEYMILIDSDSIVDKYAIAEFMKVFVSHPDVGGIVGNGKVLNASKNMLTKCQDVWYDYSFNIHKSAESAFGTVLCLSGCLAAYRRRTIARFIPYWAGDKAQYGDDRNLTTYAIATPWARGNLAPLQKKLFNGMVSYDDAEDRSLTVQSVIDWKTVYAPTAVVYTEVPENWRTYLRQQIRWRKGYLRSTFFTSAFFWRKNPIIAFLFYLEFMMTFIAPAITISIFVYSPIVLQSWLFPLIYVAGQTLVGIVAGLDYKLRDPTAKYWMYKPIMNMISVLVLPWILLPALWSFRKNSWLTR